MPLGLFVLFNVLWLMGDARWHKRDIERRHLVAPAQRLADAVERFHAQKARYPATVDELRSLRDADGQPALAALLDGAKRHEVDLVGVRIPKPGAGARRVLVVVSGPKGRIEILPGGVARLSNGLAGHCLPEGAERGSWVRTGPDGVIADGGQ